MNENIIQEIKRTKWHADWGGTTPLVDISFAPDLYFFGLNRNFEKRYSKVFVIIKKGVAQGYLPEQEYKRLGTSLAKKLKTIKDAKKWSNEFIDLADKMYAIIDLPPKEFLKKWRISKH